MLINVTFDTVSKEVKCSMDGKDVADFYSANFYSYGIEDGKVIGTADICSMKFDKEAKIGTQTKIYASEENQLSKTIAANIFPDIQL